MGGSTTLLVVTACVTTAAFDFDHAFRKISSSTGDAGEVDSVDTLLRRIGLAMGEEGGEEGKEGETLAHDSLFRRLGEPEDQEAVESQELPQFFSAQKTVRAPVPKMDLSYKGDVLPRKIWKKEEVSSRRSEDASQKKKVNKDQRGSSRQANSYAAGIGSARQLVLAASKTALDSGTVATYLTQMWIGNIMQTIGWTIASSLNPANSGRSFRRSSGRRGEEEENEESVDSSLLAGVDHRTVASILRGLADAADNWEHTEL